ncbi:sushi domain-containing protein 1 isoform 2-T3 [Polymixia lowei]
MDRRHTTGILFFMLFAVADMQAVAQTLDVCASCHPNATCEDKTDGSGKVCNCMYGFVGNGRTFCQDKDECQIGANKICGQHTSCHNTYGSYYCTCMSGYSPSNNMAVFIPNDGTHCQDIDECRIPGLCGEGGQCRNTEGSFDCRCQVGYRVLSGAEPFHPQRDKASCQVIDCGQPPSVKDTVLLSATGTRYGSVAMFGCDDSSVWRSGNNSSVCSADGAWKGPTMVCEELLCGSPPLIKSAEQVWNGNSTPGSTVLYFCKEGFHNKGGNNLSLCNENGHWTQPTLSCQEISCGDPPILPHTGQLWNGSSTPGTKVFYYCKKGVYDKKTNNVSLCTIYGYWTKPNISCKEISCGDPPILPHTGQLWNGSSTPGTKVFYYCKKGVHDKKTNNVSLCTISGYWTKPNISCKEISCGDPPILPHTGQLWNGSSTPGTKVFYYCKKGVYDKETNNVSLCTISGYWTKPNISCKAKCGPAPFLANSEVVWHNRSVVVYRCVDGYHSWRGSKVSVCGNTGVWHEATLRCIEIKPVINDLIVFNEKCLQWKAEKYEEDTEIYKVIYMGSREYQRSFHDRRKRFLRSKADQLELCLNLLPVTNYTISITAVSARFTADVTTNTSLQVPEAPVIYYREVETPLPTLSLHRLTNTMDPISLYQVFVLPVERTIVFDCTSPGIPDFSSRRTSLGQYVTAQIKVSHVGTEMNFTVGDGLYYDGFFNAPLKNGGDYYIILRVVSQWKEAFKSSCVLWAKVRGTSYVMKISSLSASGSIGLVSLIILAGYSYTWFCKKT